MEIIVGIIGLITGIVIAVVLFRQSYKTRYISKDIYTDLDKQKIALQSQLQSGQDQLGKANSDLDISRQKINELSALVASSATTNKNLEERLASQKNELEQLQERFTKEFENLANKILEEKSIKFTEQNRANLDIILNPLKEKIKDFEEKVEKTYKAESTERIILKTEIKNLIELNKKISEEANNLATALKGDNKQQGNWGEMVLEKILESSGLAKDNEYKTQVTSQNAEGEKIKPDVVVFLPDEKHIIIDSKVSLVAYDAFVNSLDGDDRERYKREHINSIRNHIRLLGDKNYQTASGLQSPDFVLMFIPIESSFGVAVQADQEIFNYAWNRKIVLVSPSTLLATLRTIASIWKQERQTRNALLIAEEGGKLYDKLVGFVEDLIKVGRKMDDAKKDYVEAMKKLTDGSGNVIRRAEKMKELGAKATKTIPESLLERIE